MDQQMLKKLALFKMGFKKLTGRSADIARFINDKDYALATLSAAEETDDADLVLLALTLKADLGLLNDPVVEKTRLPEAKPSEKLAPDKKYVFGARG